jgi:hypothetical protein
MPVQFPDAARIETHVHARDGGGNLEVGLGDLTGPAAVLDAPRRVVERGPEQGKVSHVGRGRRERLWKLPCWGMVLRSRIDGAARVALRVYDALRRSGLPKLAALTRFAKAPMPAAAPTARISRMEAAIVESLIVGDGVFRAVFRSSPRGQWPAPSKKARAAWLSTSQSMGRTRIRLLDTGRQGRPHGFVKFNSRSEVD